MEATATIGPPVSSTAVDLSRLRLATICSRGADPVSRIYVALLDLAKGLAETEQSILREALPTLEQHLRNLTKFQRQTLASHLEAILQQHSSTPLWQNESVGRWSLICWISELVIAGRSLGTSSIAEPGVTALLNDLREAVTDASKGSSRRRAAQLDSNIAPHTLPPYDEDVAAKLSNGVIQHVLLLRKLLPGSYGELVAQLFLHLQDPDTKQLSANRFLNTRFKPSLIHDALGNLPPLSSFTYKTRAYQFTQQLHSRLTQLHGLAQDDLSVEELIHANDLYLSKEEITGSMGASLRSQLQTVFALDRDANAALSSGLTLLLRNGYLLLPCAKTRTLEEINRSQLACIGEVGILAPGEVVSADDTEMSKRGFAAHDVGHLMIRYGSDTKYFPSLVGEDKEHLVDLSFVSLTRRMAFTSQIAPIYLEASELSAAISPETGEAFQAEWFKHGHESAGNYQLPWFLRPGDREVDQSLISRIQKPRDFGAGLKSRLGRLTESEIKEHLQMALNCFNQVKAKYPLTSKP